MSWEGHVDFRHSLTPCSAMTGDVIELGDGSTGAKKHDFQLKVGDTIIYSKFGIGVTDVQFHEAEHALLREDDVIGVLPRSGATAADLPEIRPLGDRVLLKVLPHLVAMSEEEGVK